ncbi:methyltransferase domain-containing protein [Agrobacterium rhizogenes]|uniref:methyltransferase domain-containing protein n=1 Tax=Rhizobium rhizogenes TaxID=359 RepID=UPI0015737353|nr:methyltransferase domain-containing protein [Rhizobium rhizogenes]NTG48956.1 methyltransferase domain-containing protein [Rhizobium rhizogenes]
MKQTTLLQSETERREVLLSLFSQDGFGLEVGPSYNPLLPKSEGYNVETVDHADADALRKKYSNNASKIENVDYVSDGRSLLELIGQPERYDYIVASHVIEHVTDIVRFIQDCESLLKPDGTLLLVVPDKRFCFDAMRPVSTLGEALQAYREARSRHTPGQVFDFVNSFVKKGGTTIWVDIDRDDMEFANSPQSALKEFEIAQKVDEYIDIHAWRFTPSYFQYFIKTLRSLGFIQSGDTAVVVNDDSPIYRFEFYVTLSKSAPVNHVPDLDLLKSAEDELHEIRVSKEPNATETLLASAETLLAEKDLLIVETQSRLAETQALVVEKNKEIADKETELARLHREVAALRSSSSWKLTAPLRYLKGLSG